MPAHLLTLPRFPRSGRRTGPPGRTAFQETGKIHPKNEYGREEHPAHIHFSAILQSGVIGYVLALDSHREDLCQKLKIGR